MEMCLNDINSYVPSSSTPDLIGDQSEKSKCHAVHRSSQEDEVLEKIEIRFGRS